MALFRFMVIDEDGRRIGRFEADDPNWREGDTFTLDEQLLRIVEILPEVSTMVAYNAVWVATPVADEDERAHGPAAPDANVLRPEGASARDFERDGERAARL